MNPTIGMSRLEASIVVLPLDCLEGLTLRIPEAVVDLVVDLVAGQAPLVDRRGQRPALCDADARSSATQLISRERVATTPGPVRRHRE